MNFNNPLEIIIAVVLVLASIWIVERIIAGAFKTVIAAIFIVGILSFFTYTKHTTKHKPLPKIGPPTDDDFPRSSRQRRRYCPEYPT